MVVPPAQTNIAPGHQRQLSNPRGKTDSQSSNVMGFDEQAMLKQKANMSKWVNKNPQPQAPATYE